MKIFLDSSHVEIIREYNALGLIDGITTNPTNLAKAGGNPLDHILEICSIMDGKDVSVEVTELEPTKLYLQAKEIARLANNVVIKVPCHKDYYLIIKRLIDEGYSLNITLVFNVIQSLYMAKLGAKYISPFVGRWDDIDIEGSDLLIDVRCMLDQYGYETQLLAASMRSLRHVSKAIAAGADIATLSVKIFQESMEHFLTDQGIKQFDHDWKKLNVLKFP